MQPTIRQSDVHAPTWSGLPGPAGQTLSCADSEPPINLSQLGKYFLVRKLGQGGMGVVYEALDTVLQRPVALKLPSAGQAADPQALRRFLLEGQLAARLNHPHAVTIYEVDQREGVPYIAMELIRGGSAQDYLSLRGPFPWSEATQIVAAASRALSAAHAGGLIHRDIKPGNIMRTAEGVVKLADFGLAKLTGLQQVSTGSGQIVGTPEFMSPEQCRSEPLDERSDLYSLGATYYALLTGLPPYGGTGPMQVMFAHCSSAVPDPRTDKPDIPASCVAIVQRALAKDPAERYATAAEMRAELEALLGVAGAAPELPLSGWNEGTLPSPLPDSSPTMVQPPQGDKWRHPALPWVGFSALFFLVFLLSASLLKVFSSTPPKEQQPPAASPVAAASLPEQSAVPAGQDPAAALPGVPIELLSPEEPKTVPPSAPPGMPELRPIPLPVAIGQPAPKNDSGKAARDVAGDQRVPAGRPVNPALLKELEDLQRSLETGNHDLMSSLEMAGKIADLFMRMQQE